MLECKLDLSKEVQKVHRRDWCDTTTMAQTARKNLTLDSECQGCILIVNVIIKKALICLS